MDNQNRLTGNSRAPQTREEYESLEETAGNGAASRLTFALLAAAALGWMKNILYPREAKSAEVAEPGQIEADQANSGLSLEPSGHAVPDAMRAQQLAEQLAPDDGGTPFKDLLNIRNSSAAIGDRGQPGPLVAPVDTTDATPLASVATALAPLASNDNFIQLDIGGEIFQLGGSGGTGNSGTGGPSLRLVTPQDEEASGIPPGLSTDAFNIRDIIDNLAGDEEENDRDERSNRPPVSIKSVILPALFVEQSVIIGSSSLLQHSSDPDGDSLEVLNLTASSGQIESRGDGTWRFTPDTGDISDVTLSYLVGDGRASTAQTAWFDLVDDAELLSDEWYEGWHRAEGAPQAETGTPADGAGTSNAAVAVIDTPRDDGALVGTDDDDIISGSGGGDVIYGQTGDDVIYAGAGNDTIYGGGGNDIIFAEAGDDVIEGGDGDDLVDGGGGDDLVVARMLDGDDNYFGGAGSDTLDISATGADAVIDLGDGIAYSNDIGFDNIDSIENVIGGAGNDGITASDQRNYIRAGEGDDTIYSGVSDDAAPATAASEPAAPAPPEPVATTSVPVAVAMESAAPATDGSAIDEAAYASVDIYDGGLGSDTLDLSRTTADAVIDLSSGKAASSDIGEVKLTDIENVVGGSGADVFIANNEINLFIGGPGADRFVFTQIEAISDRASHRDRISDFSVGDRVDLSQIDANIAIDGEQDFILLSSRQEVSGAAQLYYFHEYFEQIERTILSGYVDDDGEVDFELEFDGCYEFTSNDFDGVQ